MTGIAIRHETLYQYGQPVAFGLHRLLVRPQGTHATRIVSAELTVSPPGQTRWAYDALGNCVCWYAPDGLSDRLSIVSELVIERYPAPLAPFKADDPHTALPIVYELKDRVILEPFLALATEDEDHTLINWVRACIGSPHEPALALLLRVNNAIHDELTYCPRFEEGVQTPGETLRSRQGTCRDFAWLMTEALRRLGYAARFVTGYLYAPETGGLRGASATHAWVQAFLPDLGWLEFDPTNGLAESADLIPVAVARTPQEAAPVTGLLVGDPAGSTLTVSVEVRPFEDSNV
jgi:YD repeat-containing protein